MPNHKFDTGQFAPWGHIESEFFKHVGDRLGELEAAYKEADSWRGTKREQGGILANLFSFLNRDKRLTSDSGGLYVPNAKIRALEDRILWELFEYKRKLMTE